MATAQCNICGGTIEGDAKLICADCCDKVHLLMIPPVSGPRAERQQQAIHDVAGYINYGTMDRAIRRLMLKHLANEEIVDQIQELTRESRIIPFESLGV